MARVVGPRCLAFFLPQYHPIPENDEWWGAGFTEWRNVAKAKPQFWRHYQPHLPADLGYYDLRVPEVRELQAAMAREAGVDGFVYYHYWFNGRRLLERPLDEVVRSRSPDFPFCIAWANENWTRRWDGGEHEILIAQTYSLEDDLRHVRALKPYLTDDRYIKDDGRPVVLIYRSNLLPDVRATTDIWRGEVERWGLPGLYLIRMETFPGEAGDPVPLGFDAAMQFQPQSHHMPAMPTEFEVRAKLGALMSRYPQLSIFTERCSHRVVRYTDLAGLAMSLPQPSYLRWPGVTPGFDNSPRRRKAATILVDSTPEAYAAWLGRAVSLSSDLAVGNSSAKQAYVFINAWNEWGEGNHLEPDLRYGKAYIEATRLTIDAGASIARSSITTQDA